jgi:ABC-type hemin transport system substrate-binding protein
MAIGPDTFAAAVLARAGLDAVPADGGRYPTLEAAALRALDPDLVLLLSEPFPFRARHADELAVATGIGRDRFRAVDGQLLTWHGTRLARALPRLADHVAHGFPEVA